MKAARRRCLSSVLHNLVDTLASRNCDFEGYWFWGFLLSDSSFSVDLMNEDELTGPNPRAAFTRLARKLLKKEGLGEEHLRHASLHIHRSDAEREWTIDGRFARGFDVTPPAKAIADTGTTYEAERTLWAAPHDAVPRYSFGMRERDRGEHGGW